MNIRGLVRFIGNMQNVSASFQTREIVVTIEEQYPQHISIQFTQDKCDLLNQYRVGNFVNIGINIRGREWVNPQGETKYFNTIQGWKIALVTDHPANQTAQAAAERQQPNPNNEAATRHAAAFTTANDFKEEDHDDLPF